MRPADREDVVKIVDKALKKWGSAKGLFDMQLTWEVYINLYIDKLSSSQQELVRKAKLGIVDENFEWKWMVDELTAHIWKHLQQMEEI